MTYFHAYFDYPQVLNSELKLLYTAITRARQNVWIFDEDLGARAPVFEYFKALKLVQIVPEGGTHIVNFISCVILARLLVVSGLMYHYPSVCLHREALFLFCWAKVLGPTFFYSQQFKIVGVGQTF